MCENIPRSCISGDTDTLGESAKRMAVPNFNVIKGSVDKILTKIKELEKSEDFLNGTPNAMKLYEKLLQQKETSISALKNHKDYEKFSEERRKEKADKKDKFKSITQLNSEDFENFKQKLKKMASPKKVAYLSALATVNRALEKLTEDKFWCHYPHKKRLYKSLILQRKKLCRKLSKFPKSPSEPHICFRFQPCSRKIVKMWTTPYRKTRKLNVNFDESTKVLGFPKIPHINYAIKKYEELILVFKEKMKEDLEFTEQKLKFLKNLKDEIENYKLREREELKTKCLEKYGKMLENQVKNKKKKKNKQVRWRKPSKAEKIFPPKGYWEQNEQLNAFSNSLEIPSRRRLENILNYQRKLLKEIEKVDKIKNPGKNNFCCCILNFHV